MNRSYSSLLVPRLARVSLLAAAALLAVATSMPRHYPMRTPVYLSWDALRRAVRVEPPRPITRRGKIYVYRKRLFVSDPNRGIHVIDNRDPRQPRQEAFLNIPGNVDVAIRQGYLYADSFVDLLVFRLAAEAQQIALVRRVRGVFPYDPYQTLTDDGPRWTKRVDRRKGVVIRWK